jgi:hypothetical protein
MPGTVYSPASSLSPLLDSVPAEPEVICAGAYRDLGPGMAPGPVGIGDDILDGLGQQRLVTESALFSEMLLTPLQEHLDIAPGGRGEAVPG